MHWDLVKKGFEEAETLAKIVGKIRAAWRYLGQGGDGG